MAMWVVVVMGCQTRSCASYRRIERGEHSPRASGNMKSLDWGRWERLDAPERAEPGEKMATDQVYEQKVCGRVL